MWSLKSVSSAYPSSSASSRSGSSNWGEPRDKASRAKAKERQKRCDRLEAEVERLGGQLAEVDASLADPALYDGQRDAEVARLQAERGEIGARLETAETEWLEAQEEA